MSGIRLAGRHARPALRGRGAAPRPRPSVRARPGRSDAADAFSSVENLVRTADVYGPEASSLEWEQIADCWVVRPPSSTEPPEATCLFLGGAFVGAAPELTYRMFLERLATRNILVVTVPYATGFDQSRTVDTIFDKYQACMKILGPETRGLPNFGVGHSLGALLTVLSSTKYNLHGDGNVLISFNNRPATDVIPFLSPYVAPSTRSLFPLLAQIAESPVSSTVDSIMQSLRTFSPSLVQQLLPLVQQISPVLMEVGRGRSEFTPTPAEMNELVLAYYSVSNNLLIRFKEDSIDETGRMATLLQDSRFAANMSVDMKTLHGDHMRPLQQDIPPELSSVASNTIKASGSLINSLSGFASGLGLDGVTAPLKDMEQQASVLSSAVGSTRTVANAQSIEELADEVAAWMGVGKLIRAGTKHLSLPGAGYSGRL